MPGYRLYEKSGSYRGRPASVEIAPEASVNIKKWIGYAEFCSLPKTLQKLYLSTQAQRFNVGVMYYASAWNIAVPTVKRYFDEFGIALPAGTKKADKQRFLEFVKGEDL